MGNLNADRNEEDGKPSLLLICDSNVQPPRNVNMSKFTRVAVLSRQASGKSDIDNQKMKSSEGIFKQSQHCVVSLNDEDDDTASEVSSNASPQTGNAAHFDGCCKCQLDTSFITELTRQLQAFAQNGEQTITLSQLVEYIREKSENIVLKQESVTEGFALRPFGILKSKRQAEENDAFSPIQINCANTREYSKVGVLSIAWEKWYLDDDPVNDDELRDYLQHVDWDSRKNIQNMSSSRLSTTVARHADNQSNVKKVERKKLSETLIGEYYFEWEEYDVPISHDCQEQLKQRLELFIEEHGKDERDLVIIEYSGHGGFSERSNGLTWSG